MEQNIDTKILARVRKMLALANDSAASEGERDNAMRMAHATLAKHNLDMADAEASGATPEEARGQGFCETKNLAWARSCAAAVAELFFCKYLYITKRGSTNVQHCFIGRTSNVETAKLISAFVIASITRQAYREWKNHPSPSVWWTAFCKGATNTVRTRCAQLRRAAEAASNDAKPTGTSLVLASVYATELAANAALMAQLHANVRTTKSRQKHPRDYNAFAAGQAFGQTISLNRQVSAAPVRTAFKGGQS